MNKKIITGIIIVVLVGFLFVLMWFGFFKKAISSSKKSPTITTQSTKPELFMVKNFKGYKLNTIDIDGEKIPLLKIPVVTWGGYAALFAANNGIKPNKNSLFYKNGKFVVELVDVEDPIEQLKGFAKGENPIIWATMDMLPLMYHILKSNKNSRPKVFGIFDWSTGGDAIVVRDTIKNPKDIKGKTIVTAANTPSNFFLLWLLSQLNLTPSDVKIKYVNDAIQAKDVFETNNKIDMCVTWSPFHLEAVDKVANSKILITSKDANQLIADCYIARNDFIKDHPEIIKAFSKSMMEGYDVFISNKDAVFNYMAKLFNLPGGANDAKDMLGDVHITNFADNKMFFDDNNTVGAKYLFYISTEYYKIDGTLPQDVNYDASNVLFTKNIDEFQKSGLFKSQKSNIKKVKSFSNFDMEDFESNNVVLSEDLELYFAPQRTEFNFDGTSARILENKKQLQKIAEQMDILGTTVVWLIGHLDTSKVESIKAQGNDIWLQMKAAANLVSEKRAIFVKKVLVEKYHCDPDRIKTSGRGWSEPLDVTDQSKNRRVEVKFFSYE